MTTDDIGAPAAGHAHASEAPDTGQRSLEHQVEGVLDGPAAPAPSGTGGPIAWAARHRALALVLVLAAGAAGSGLAFLGGAFQSGAGAAVPPDAVRMTFAVDGAGGSGSVSAAATVIDQRLKAAGLTATAQADGANLVVTAPKDRQATVLDLIEPGSLQFRPVLDAAALDAAGTPSPPSVGWAPAPAGDRAAAGARLQSLRCTGRPDLASVVTDTGTGYLATCDRADTAKYLLGPSEVAGTDVTKAQAAPVMAGQTATGNWQVELTFDAKGTAEFATATQRLYQQYASQSGSGEFAIVLDGVVQCAPVVNQGAITGGQAQIAGQFTRQQAQDLAAMLTYGSLPVLFHLVGTTSG